MERPSAEERIARNDALILRADIRPRIQDALEHHSVNDSSGCILWDAAHNQGYGLIVVSIDGRARNFRAHRCAWLLKFGPMPLGKVMDHLCGNRGCVNTDHLESVTNRINVLRGRGTTAENAAKTHCKYGHEFTPENTKKVALGRSCRICIKASRKRDKRRRPIQQEAS